MKKTLISVILFVAMAFTAHAGTDKFDCNYMPFDFEIGVDFKKAVDDLKKEDFRKVDGDKESTFFINNKGMVDIGYNIYHKDHKITGYVFLVLTKMPMDKFHDFVYKFMDKLDKNNGVADVNNDSNNITRIWLINNSNVAYVVDTKVSDNVKAVRVEKVAL